MSYKHLSQTERYQIHALLKAKLTYSQISDILGRHRSTISREISRNAGRRGYRPRQAEQVLQAIINKLEPLACLVKTIAFNNCKKLSDHAFIDQALNSTIYFSQPYASCQRGSNENYNVLLLTFPRNESYQQSKTKSLK